MPLVINHNLMAANSARQLSSHYSQLATSVRRLSSGLRVGTAADDAAGLAIRELMRADIAAFNQGIRNVNDAISMVQTVDGALQIIDEKLIRMKELAEQAATGTYNSDQRLMINDEYQAMAAEIERIARQTNFNGIKLLCNDIANKLPVKREIELMSYIALDDYSPGNHLNATTSIQILNPDAITKSVDNLRFNNGYNINVIEGNNNMKDWFGHGDIWEIGTGNNNLGIGHPPILFGYSADTQTWTILSDTGQGERLEFYEFLYNGPDGFGLFIYGNANLSMEIETGEIHLYSPSIINPGQDFSLKENTIIEVLFEQNSAIYFGFSSNKPVDFFRLDEGEDVYPNAKILRIHNYSIGSPIAGDIRTIDDVYVDLDGDGKADIVLTMTWRGVPQYDILRFQYNFKLNAEYTTKIHFGPGNDPAEDYYYSTGLALR